MLYRYRNSHRRCSETYGVWYRADGSGVRVQRCICGLTDWLTSRVWRAIVWTHFQSNLNISILYFNARSLLPKLDLLKAEVVAHNPSVIVESWLSENIDDNEISIDNYHITRLDRSRHGGGVLAYVHNSLTCEILLKGPNDLELIALLVSSVHTTAKHCILYRPPSSPVSFFDNLCTTLHHLSPPRFSNFVLIGDLNVKFL